MNAMAYCTPVADFATIELAEAAAIARHSHYYTDVAGWVFRADVVSYAYIIDADREAGTTFSFDHFGTTTACSREQLTGKVVGPTRVFVQR